MLKDFRQFVARGNVIDLAIGVVIGAAFGKVVDSLVKDIVMPPIGLLLKRVDFNSLFIDLSGDHYATLAEAQKAAAPTINYGLFINTLLQFVIVAFAVFLLIRQYNRLREQGTAAPSEQACPFCRLKIPLAASRCGHCTSQLPSGAMT